MGTIRVVLAEDHVGAYYPAALELAAEGDVLLLP